MREDPRYRWLGDLPHWQAMRLLSRSHAMVISSLMEGGAHVVSEAIALGVPVIASDIPGNRGLLSKDYPALFPAGDEAALAALIRRAMNDPAYLRTLGRAVRLQSALVEPLAEQRAWRVMLDALGLQSAST
jgi:glycosyltransferase involved in cell wall biosynthesis